MSLQIKKLTPEAKIPVRSTNHAAGYDLYALEDGIIRWGEKKTVRTGISIALPTLEPPFKVYGSIRSRSGLSYKHNIEVGAGILDQDYRGEVMVILYNHSQPSTEFKYSAGDRIAQLILEVHITPSVLEVSELQELENNNRNENGFGSTGR